MIKEKILFLFGITLLLSGCSATILEETPSPTIEIIPTATTSLPTEVEDEVEIQSTLTPEPDQRVVFLGVYPSGFLQNQVNEIIALDEWTASIEKRTTFAATFMDFEYPNLETHIPAELNAAWDNGYVPFVNLAVGYHQTYTAEEIAAGMIDDQIRQWASVYANWCDGGKKWAMIAPLQEMNGFWTAYGEDPENFLLAYRRIQDLFYQEGVTPEGINWVFAPNGWSTQGNEFENYYPGDDVVDVIGLSSFNFGDCSNWPRWEVFEDIYEPYLDRMYAMAPEKPIFIAEIGTVAEGGDKNIWLMDTYTKLINHPGLVGIIYFNRPEFASSLEKCPNGTDYRIFDNKTSEGYFGYLEGISSPQITYYPPDSQAMKDLLFTRFGE